VRHIANMRDPSVPAALAPAIEGIVSLNDFKPKSMVVHRPQYTFPFTGPITGTHLFDVVPIDLATIYNFKPLFAAGFTGRGQTIALLEDTDVYNPNDSVTFRKTFGLDAYSGSSLRTIHPGGCMDPGATSNDFEAEVDVEWASAAAPSTEVELVGCADTTTVFGGLIALQNLVNEPYVPSTVDLSYGLCEAQNGAAANAAYKEAYLQASLEGVSVFVVAGDNGASYCDFLVPAISGVAVNGLASTPFNTAVGGTDFGDTYAGLNSKYWSQSNGPNYGSALSYVPEIPWNDTCVSGLITHFLGYASPFGPNAFCAVANPYFLYPIGGSGGPSNCATGVPITESNGATPSNGTCKGYPKPIWQYVFGNPQDAVRDLPDISLFASDGSWNHAYIFCDSDTANYGRPCVGPPSTWSLEGGTSFAGPIMAGMQALVNQVWGGRQADKASPRRSTTLSHGWNTGRMVIPRATAPPLGGQPPTASSTMSRATT
jgi:subtilase family serine protease